MGAFNALELGEISLIWGDLNAAVTVISDLQ
jgi:hypothetical protein